MNNPQLNKNGELQHLLTTDGLPARILRDILDKATEFVNVAEGREIKKVPLLHGKSVFNIFFENSTRTRTTFEIAAKRLSADVVNLNIGSSSHQQGRDPAGYGGQPVRDACRHVRGAPFIQRGGAPDRPACRAGDSCHQRRRRAPCAPHAGAARHVHHPPLQEGIPQPARRHRRRRAAFARGAFADPRADHAGRAGSARGRAEDAVAHAMSKNSACRSITT